MSHYQEKVIERLREKLADQRERRQDDLRVMQAEHDRTMAVAETDRLDAIQLAETRRVDANRQADAAAVLLATTRAELTASTLAEKVTDTAGAAAEAVEATTQSLGARIKPLEDARYESGGAVRGRTDVTKVIWAVIGAAIPIALYLLARSGAI